MTQLDTSNCPCKFCPAGECLMADVNKARAMSIEAKAEVLTNPFLGYEPGRFFIPMWMTNAKAPSSLASKPAYTGMSAPKPRPESPRKPIDSFDFGDAINQELAANE